MKNKEILPARFTTPEARLAIACLGFELGCTGEITLPDGLEWGRFYQFIEKNRLAPHFSVLAKRLPVDFPEEIKHELKLARYQNLLYGDACKLQVHQVLAGLKEAGIPVIVLKGWAAIQWLYGGDHGQRVYDDIDILVPVQNKEAVEAVLEKGGFSPILAVDPDYADRFSNAKAFTRPAMEVNLGKQFSIGFHWGLTHFPYYDRERINTDELFDRSLPLQVAGVGVAELSLEDQLIYACAHLALHHRNDETLLQYFEIAAIPKRAGAALDWDSVINRAKGWGYLAQLRVVLSAVNSLWKDIPGKKILDRLDQVPIPWKERWLDQMVAGVKGNPIRSAFVEVLALPGIANKLRAIWFNMFPPRRYMEHRYNSQGKSMASLYWIRVKGAISRFIHSGNRSDVKVKLF